MTATTFALDYRPDIFREFDELLLELERLVPRVDTRAEIKAALEVDGRYLEVDQLVAELGLEPDVADVVRELASFGDTGQQVHTFGAIVLARVNSGSLLSGCDMTTYLLAARRRGKVDVSWHDENGGSGSLGTREQVPSFLEVTVLMDAVLVAQAPYDLVDGNWCSGYFRDDSMIVSVTSEVYSQLREWYRRVIDEWSLDGQAGES